MDDDTRELLDERIADIRTRKNKVAPTMSGGVNSSWLARVLTDNGFSVSALTVQKHIGGRCRCGY